MLFDSCQLFTIICVFHCPDTHFASFSYRNIKQMHGASHTDVSATLHGSADSGTREGQ